MDIQNDYFLVTFRSRSDYLKALSGGPSTIFGHYLTVDPWTADFSATVPFPTKVVVWIRLPGLPVILYKKSIITEIGECIGPVVKMDFHTECGRRGRFARMAVRIDLGKPLISKILINERLQLVEYESLPIICFKCGRYGHLLENCRDFESKLQLEEPMEAPVIPEQVKPASPFGPWMVVERRQRRLPKKPVANPGKSDGVVFHASRFNPIHDLDQVDPSGKGVESFPQPQSQSVVKTALSKAKLKSKISHRRSLKSANVVHVRKPLSVTLADFPVLSRNHNKASTSRLASKNTPIVTLDTSKHSTIVMDENSDPNVHHFVRPLDDPTNNNFSHIAGGSSTRPLGDPLDNFINSVVQPEGLDALGKIGNNSGTDPTEGLSHALGPLRDYLVNPDSFFPASSLSDLLDSEGNWDRGKLAEYFTIDALPHILSIKSPDPMDTDDFIIWRWDPKYVFKTKSTYFRLASSSWDFTNLCWTDIWKTRVPQRLRLFLWIAFRDRLMTNLERCRRSVGHHPYCTTCDTHDESTLHVLRDCKFARDVWLYFSPSLYSPTFFTESLQAWLLSNINCHDPVSDYSIPWSTIFVSILWQLWKARNEHVFNSIPQSPTAVWNKGYFGLVATWRVSSRLSFDLLILVLFIGLALNQIQSDCAEAVKLIKADNAYMSPISLVRAIAALRQKAWATEITWIPRTSNLPADMLAKSVDPSSTDFHELA
ncbi:hypothetical protein V6N11_071211 [Hibiscus sabdariffa]|uniref:CCHC-type domain-containing protein n=1 Tax=Hibiscus sabdariffa TaxID=183260 RepID=A0ABR2TZJ7_9ROSI